jgi:hypothetical protein
VTECDDVMQCSIAAVDLASGRHEPFPALDASRYFGQPVALSPDGSLLAFMNEHALLEVVDIGSGETVLTDKVINQDRGPVRIIWSDDGKWLAVSDVGGLLLWRRGWTESRRIDLPGALSFALAPAAP